MRSFNRHADSRAGSSSTLTTTIPRFPCSVAAATGLQASTKTTMSDKYQAAYDRLCNHAREAAILNSMQGLLGWDERTKLPPAGGEYRAEQMSFLAGLIHKKQTAPEVGEW